MYHFSDSSSSDSEDGIRYKTESTRKFDNGVTSRKPEHNRHNRDFKDYAKSNDRHNSNDRNQSRRRSRDRSRNRENRSESSSHYSYKRRKHTSSDDDRKNLKSSRTNKVHRTKTERNRSRRSSSPEDDSKDGKSYRMNKLLQSSKSDNIRHSSSPEDVKSSRTNKLTSSRKECDRVDNRNESSQSITERNNYCAPKLSNTHIIKASRDKTELENLLSGPKLPTNLMHKKRESNSPSGSVKSNSIIEDKNEDQSICSPQLQLPSTLKKSNTSNENTDSDLINSPQSISIDECTSICGPQLPQTFSKNSNSGDETSSVCGPQLPQTLSKKTNSGDEASSICGLLTLSKKSNSGDETSTICGPKLPQTLSKKSSSGDETSSICGPEVPQTFSKNSNSGDDSSPICGPEVPEIFSKKGNSGDENCGPQANQSISGPQLPPHLLEPSRSPKEEKYIGPSLPPNLRKELADKSGQTVNEEDDDTYGPLPPEMIANSEAHIALEERAWQMKLDALGPTNEDKTVREEWMLELPGVHVKNLGLGPRQFRAKAGPDLSDRSSWTDTPNSKKNKSEKKVDIKKEAEVLEILKRDQKQEEMSKKHKKKEKSLLEQHQKKLKKEEKVNPDERVPFNRETDLKVNRFDEAQKKAIYKKAQLLDDRFSKGQSKFL